MARKMVHCFWCGEELGVYETWPGDMDTCGKMECEKHARYERQAQDADARQEAAEDNYNRYR